MKIALSNITAARLRNAANEINSDRMPTGRYGFTVTKVVFSDKENDMALYVNYTVHGNSGMSKQMSVRCEPQMSDDNVNFARNYASVATISSLLNAAKPDSGKQFLSMVAAAKVAFTTGQDEAFVAAITSLVNMTDGLSGLNFTGYFEWNTSKKDGKKYFNLRNEKGNAVQAISLDNVREPVTESAEQERQPKRNLTAVKR
jgi:hypothetical protein